jgi:hypothetical protein
VLLLLLGWTGGSFVDVRAGPAREQGQRALRAVVAQRPEFRSCKSGLSEPQLLLNNRSVSLGCVSAYLSTVFV